MSIAPSSVEGHTSGGGGGGGGLYRYPFTRLTLVPQFRYSSSPVFQNRNGQSIRLISPNGQVVSGGGRGSLSKMSLLQ